MNILVTSNSPNKRSAFVELGDNRFNFLLETNRKDAFPLGIRRLDHITIGNADL
jgi:hypothetical protein